MTDDDRVLYDSEVQQLLRLTSRAQVRALWRQGLLKRVPPMRPPRYTRQSVMRLLAEDYHATDAQSDWPTSPQAAAPRRGDRDPAQGRLARGSVVGGGAVPRSVGPAPTDVVVRRVEGRRR